MIGVDPRMIATNALPGSRIYMAACAVCMVRGLDPHANSVSAGMEQWRAIILEQALLLEISALLPVS